MGENVAMRSAAAVALGATIGATARWAVGELLAHLDHADGFPWPTLIVNVVGCAVLGWVAATMERRTTTWYFVVTGVLGGLTTASAFAVDTRRLLDDGEAVSAIVYVVASVGIGLLALSATRTATWRRRTAS